MQYFKDADQNTYAIYSPDQVGVLPVGAQPITRAEFEQILESRQIPPQPPTPAQQIAELERQSGMVKAVRKFMLTAMEAEAIKQGMTQGLTAEQSLAVLAQRNPGYAGVKALDNQIAQLEDLL